MKATAAPAQMLYTIGKNQGPYCKDILTPKWEEPSSSSSKLFSTPAYTFAPSTSGSQGPPKTPWVCHTKSLSEGHWWNLETISLLIVHHNKNIVVFVVSMIGMININIRASDPCLFVWLVSHIERIIIVPFILLIYHMFLY